MCEAHFTCEASLLFRRKTCAIKYTTCAIIPFTLHPTFFSKMTKWPRDLYQKNMWIPSSSMPYAIKKGHFLNDLSFLKKWPFIKKQKTLALLINILNIAPILFSTSPCRNFRYKKHPFFLCLTSRYHPDIIPKSFRYHSEGMQSSKTDNK